MFHVDGQTGVTKRFRSFYDRVQKKEKRKKPYQHYPAMYFVSLDFASAVLASGFPPTLTLYSHALAFSPTRATCPTHLILVMFVESFNREALRLCHFLCHPVVEHPLLYIVFCDLMCV